MHLRHLGIPPQQCKCWGFISTCSNFNKESEGSHSAFEITKDSSNFRNFLTILGNHISHYHKEQAHEMHVDINASGILPGAVNIQFTGEPLLHAIASAIDNTFVEK